ncbi:hypothetical protein NE619_17080 [Anaerovorax odorimutans]|uniref:Uncharacterized protein n=1 Tax=Anaerovorax odorimutans TaxID=109327 RepID=A0ABT1RTI0_9FIRM|nr:hypothetical protein [Anaerovorax odorimutans]MCQ4638446.1 hypothetical protein [Anaerovorax odorimutans]
MSFLFQAGGVDLPSPVSITINNELIWSSDTGRTQSGKMAGSVVAEKKNISVKWGILTEAQLTKIKKNLPHGFFKIKLMDLTLTVYRGTIGSDLLGDPGDGIVRYKSASVDLIER